MRFAPPPAGALVDLSDSANVWGAAPAAVAAIAAGAGEAWRYPSLYGEPLRLALARAHDVSPAQIVTGNGSTEVLRAAFTAFASSGAVIAWMEPTFVIVPILAQLLGLTPRAIRFGPSHAFDAEGLLARRAAITYLCSPNNPTGTRIPQRELLRVVDEAPGLVILDEAYADYAGETLVAEAAVRPNLLVVRTFSKSYGLAGLRVGYGVAHPDIVLALERVRGPYAVSRVAERAAVAAVEADPAWMQAHVREANELRARLSSALARVGHAPVPSHANFVCVPTRDAAALADACAQRGVLVRAFRTLPGIGDAIRVAMAPWAVLEHVVEAARTVSAVP